MLMQMHDALFIASKCLVKSYDNLNLDESSEKILKTILKCNDILNENEIRKIEAFLTIIEDSKTGVKISEKKN
jgi:hypothetical protein